MMPIPVPPPTAEPKTVEFPQPQPQYPAFQYLIEDLKRECRRRFRDSFKEDADYPGEFAVEMNTDGRSGTFMLTLARPADQWTVVRRLIIDIADNRPLRRHEIESALGAFFIE